MKAVLQHILRLKREYAKLPFFDHLRDQRLPARRRLAFLPCMAPFILSFGDLNRHVLRDEPSSDPFQRIINAHTYEDDHHWPWYIEDFIKLGHDRPARTASETLRFLWSDATIQNRMLSHRLAHLVWGAEPVVRLAIVEAIEETGQVLFSLTTQLAATVQEQTGIELRYCGEFHAQLESGHAMNSDHAELAMMDLTPGQRADALARVDRVFELFSAWTHELLRYAERSTHEDELVAVDDGIVWSVE